MQESGRTHAVVLGGSIAGLLAAHVLSRHFDRVTIIERDVFPTTAEPRKGVPQSRQIHGLLAGGRRALDAMFPGFTQGLLARGALDVDAGSCGPFYIAGRAIPHQATGLCSLLVSRPLLEGYIRERVLAQNRIEARERCVAHGLVGSASRITGVALRSESGEKGVALSADLVVDASGRGSRLPDWLQELGVAPPLEERVEVHINYLSWIIRRKPHHLDGHDITIINPHPSTRRAGAAAAMEGGRYVVTFLGYLHEPLPSDYAGTLEYARSLVVPSLYELLRDAEPLSEPAKMRFPASQRRRYERLKQFPGGLIVCGDALCAFNSAYGQGMSVAALEAQALDACLAFGHDRLSERFLRAAARLVDVPWSIVVGGDYAFDGVPGKRSRRMRWMSLYMDRLMRVATSDPEVCRVFLSVSHLVMPPSALLSPRIVWRVLHHRAAPPLQARTFVEAR